MKFVTFAGPPSSGKTSVILKMIDGLKQQGTKVGVIKFDCLKSADKKTYERHGVEVKLGLAGSLCPDHFFITNIEEGVQWGRRHGFDLLVSESAGLCNRCSPHIRDTAAVCVIDNLSGINTPDKIGPMLRFADLIAVTKGDIVSQAEREVFYHNIHAANPLAKIIPVNGISGQGASQLGQCLMREHETESLAGSFLRFTMPSALCAFCIGQTKINEEFASGNMRKIDFSD